MPSNVPNVLQKARAYSPGERIADGAVHAVAIVAGVVGFSVLFRKIALYGGMTDALAMTVYPRASSYCSAFLASTISRRRRT